MGTPQRGIISPLANITLDSLEMEIDAAFEIVFQPDSWKNNGYKIHLIRLA